MVTLFASLGCSSTLERGVLENLLPSTLFPSPRVTATESIELAVNFDTQDLGNEGRPTSRQTDGSTDEATISRRRQIEGLASMINNQAKPDRPFRIF